MVILCLLHLFVSTCHCISLSTRYIFRLPIMTKDRRWRKLILYYFFISDYTIGNKIVETLYSNRVTSENIRIHTPPLLLHSKLGCLLFSKGSSNSTSGTTLHGGNGRGKATFPPLEVRKTSKSPFTAKCLNSFCRRL